MKRLHRKTNPRTADGIPDAIVFEEPADKKPVTLRDVAAAAGVHKATAARALNHDPRITVATRQRVEKAAQSLGYRVNPMVAAWMSTRRRRTPESTATMGYVTGHPTRYGWRQPASDLPDFHAGAHARAARRGFHLEHFWLHEPGMAPARFVQILHARNVRGLIIGRMPGPDTTLHDYDWSSFSIVAVGLSLAGPLFDRVRENHFQTAATSSARCHELGFRRIGMAFVRADDIGRMNDIWVGGFMSEQMKWPEDERVPPWLKPGPAAAEFLGWFQQHRPDVIIVSQAPPAVQWLSTIGVSVPRDVSLVELRCHDPAAGNAGVYYDPARVGTLAVEMLIGHLHRQDRGVPAHAFEVLLKGVWLEGRTLDSATAARIR